MEIVNKKNKSAIVLSGMALAALGSQFVVSQQAHADDVTTDQTASTSQASSATSTSQASSATTDSVSVSSAPSSTVADTAAPASQASSTTQTSQDSSATPAKATAKQAAQIQWFHGMDPLTDKPLKDESPAQQQKAKAYMDALNKGETPEQAKKDAGVTTNDATNAEKQANAKTANPVQSNNGNGPVKGQAAAPVGGSSLGGSPSSTTTTTTTTSNGLIQTADHNKASIGAVLGIGASSIMTMLGAAGTLRRRA